MNKKIFLTTVAGLGLATTLLAGCGAKHCDRDGEMRGHHHEMKMGKKMFSQLDLTREQKSQIKDIMREARDEMREKRSPKGMMPDASEFMSKDSFDKAAFIKVHKAKMAQMEKQRDAMLEKRAENFEKIFNILTPEQREKFIELSKKEPREMRERDED